MHQSIILYITFVKTNRKIAVYNSHYKINYFDQQDNSCLLLTLLGIVVIWLLKENHTDHVNCHPQFILFCRQVHEHKYCPLFHDLATHIESGSNALTNQNAALDRSQTRFVRMLEHEFESRFEICVLIGQHITSAF